jgi:hypothetical protein
MTDQGRGDNFKNRRGWVGEGECGLRIIFLNIDERKNMQTQTIFEAGGVKIPLQAWPL